MAGRSLVQARLGWRGWGGVCEKMSTADSQANACPLANTGKRFVSCELSCVLIFG